MILKDLKISDVIFSGMENYFQNLDIYSWYVESNNSVTEYITLTQVGNKYTCLKHYSELYEFFPSKKELLTFYIQKHLAIANNIQKKLNHEYPNN